MNSSGRTSQIQAEKHATTTGGENLYHARERHRIEVIIWCAAILLLLISCFAVHAHPGPWPLDLQTTITIQHLPLASWEKTLLRLVSITNDQIPMLIVLGLWLVGLSLLRKFQQALFIAFGTLVADGIDGLISTLVGRPRPSSPLIHIYIPEPFHSFPSGHTENNTVYYGFLLYLSLARPLRQWRYYRFLLPLQIICVIMIVTIGFSRILEGSHWLTDTLGGYLSGGIFLYAIILLYRYTTTKLAARRQQRAAQTAQ